MEKSQKGDLRQVGPDKQIGEDEGREKYYRDESSSEQWPESFVGNEVDEALSRRLEVCSAAWRDGAP